MSDDSLTRLRKFGGLLIRAKADVAAKEAALEKSKETLLRIERKSLPDLMKEFDMSFFGMRDGTRFDLAEDLECGISEANEEKAHKWLKDHKCGGVIKTLLTIEFGRDELEAAQSLAKQIVKLTNKPVIVKENVHWQTLKATIRELREKGVNVPIKLFSIFPYMKAKVTPAKKRKEK